MLNMNAVWIDRHRLAVELPESAEPAQVVRLVDDLQTSLAPNGFEIPPSNSWWSVRAGPTECRMSGNYYWQDWLIIVRLLTRISPASSAPLASFF